MKEGSVDAGYSLTLKQAKSAGPTIRTLMTTLLLDVSSTTEPIRRCIGSVVELAFNNPSSCGAISLDRTFRLGPTHINECLAMRKHFSCGDKERLLPYDTPTGYCFTKTSKLK